MNQKIFYILNKEALTEDKYTYIYSILYDFQTWRATEITLVNLLKDLMIFEGRGLEMSFILSGREIFTEYQDPKNPDDKYYIDIRDRLDTDQFVIFSYDPYNPIDIIMPEKLAIKVITDWCAENTTNPKILVLCEQLKQKYEVE